MKDNKSAQDMEALVSHAKERAGWLQVDTGPGKAVVDGEALHTFPCSVARQ